MAKTLGRDLSFLLFTELYQRYSEPKARRKAFGILEAAILAFAKKGFDEVTMETIAREAAVTRPLLKYYFSDLAEIKETALKYVRLLFQKLAVDAMATAQTIDDKVRKYVEACFYWVTNFRKHAEVWFRFLNTCFRDEKLRALNTISVQTGEERIAQLLEMGRQAKLFNFSDPMAAAKLLQVMITGSLVTYVSEDLTDPSLFARRTQDACLHLIGYKGASIA